MCGSTSSLASIPTASLDKGRIGLAPVDLSNYNYLMDQDTWPSREKARLALMEEIGNSSRQNQAASDLFDEKLGAFLGTNRTDGRCLGIIEQYKAMSAGQLANESGLTTGAVTAVLDRLEAAGYVRRFRDTLDRRKIWVECTPELREIVAEIFGFYDLIGPAMMASFDAAQLEGILAFLRIGTRVNEALAAGLEENAKPGGTPADRVVQAKRFSRAMKATADRLADELATLGTPARSKKKR